MRMLITCALPYVNNVPHIGNIAGSHLPADIFARYNRLAGHETVFIGGSDEHGTPTEVVAAKLGVKPRELCDKYYVVHKEIYDWLDISYDNFSRTSREMHRQTTQNMFQRIYENGYVSEGAMKLPYCENDKRVLPDRYVEGVCPKCGYEGARGDQCESCSTLLNPDELKAPRCAICGHGPAFREMKHLFLNLDKLEGKLGKWIKRKRGIWSSQVIKLALGWINEGLKPRCITRDIKWGVKVPIKGYEDRVFYVWFDAPIGYISSTKEWASGTGKPEEWRKYWQSSNARIYHFIGKDNIPFHTLFWPGMLLANDDYSLPYRVAGLQYLNYEGGKISKSRKWGIFCENLPEAGLSSDIWRFYLTLLIPETNDTEWKWREFRERINNELVANLGNFVFRTLSFIKNNFDGRVPKERLENEDKEVLKSTRMLAGEYRRLMEDIKLRDGLRKVLELSDKGNKYFQKTEPWKTVKEDKIKAANTLYVCANLCYDLAIMLSPFLPKSSESICRQIGVELEGLEAIGMEKVRPGQRLDEILPIFPKLRDDEIDKLRKVTTRVTKFEDMFRAGIPYDEFEKIDLRVGKVVRTERIDGSKKLLKLTVKVGGDEKQLVAGLGGKYSPKA
ncbi:MAG: methionine--tRNA ligase, partial [Candidatus Hydrothermarchaeota archaeon]|nr:methionine--tRNA ligase [Candidatus Hydrothermarchaeota archaeon]